MVGFMSKEFINDVLEYFEFNEQYKTIVWKKKPKQTRISIGSIAGRVTSPNGITEHYRIGFRGNVYFGHKLAWIIHHKEMPPEIIDHINGDGLDNRKSNLAKSSFKVNNKNKRLTRKNKLGIHGIRIRGNGRFEVVIGDNGNIRYLGSSYDFFEACCLRKSWERKLNFSINHGAKNREN